MRSRLRSLTPGPLSATVNVHSRGLRAALDRDHGRRLAAELQRVGEQVLEHARQLALDAEHGGQRADLDPCAGRLDLRGESVEEALDHAAQVDGLRGRRAAADAREVEQAVDEPGAVRGGRAQMGDDLAALGVDAALEQRGELGDGHERLAQVVRGDVGEALELGVRARAVRPRRACGP